MERRLLKQIACKRGNYFVHEQVWYISSEARYGWRLVFLDYITIYWLTMPDWRSAFEVMTKGRTISNRLVNVRESLTVLSQSLTWTDFRSNFSAVHRSPGTNSYAFSTSVTDTTTTSGIIASGSFRLHFFPERKSPPDPLLYRSRHGLMHCGTLERLPATISLWQGRHYYSRAVKRSHPYRIFNLLLFKIYIYMLA